MKWLMTAAAIALSALPHTVLATTWSNFAGLPGGAGNVTGTTTAARLAYPVGCILDSAGSIYMVDNTYKIRKSTAAGVVTIFSDLSTVAMVSGQTVPNYNAQLCAITCDTATNTFYATDRNMHVIWKITSAGVASIFVGAPPTAYGYGAGGYLDGAPNAALFNSPMGLVYTSSGIVVCDTDNSVVRLIPMFFGAPQITSTLAGWAGVPGYWDDTGTLAQFRRPTGIALAGSVFLVVDSDNYVVRKMTSTGIVTTLAGQPGVGGMADGAASVAQFAFAWQQPSQISVDGTGVAACVADGGNNNIRRITISTGLTSTWIGSTTGLTGYADGVINACRFANPCGFVLGPTAANLAYVADTNNSTLRRVPISTRSVTTLNGAPPHPGFVNGTGSAARFQGPNAMVVNSAGIVYVLENNGIRKISTTGVVSNFLLYSDPFFATHSGINGLSVDSAGNIIACSGSSEIYTITPAGVPSVLASGFSSAYSVAVSASGIFVYDLGTNLIYQSVGGGAFNPVSLTGVTLYSSAALAAQPTVAGYYVYCIGKLYQVTGTTATLLAGGGPYGDGVGSAAGFYSYGAPNSIAVNAGTVYVADNRAGTVRQVTSGGVVTTLGGVRGQWGGVAGATAVSRFGSPYGICVTTAGTIYVSDYSIDVNDILTGNNHNIWKGL